MKILCWNVNGIRAASLKGFLPWLYKESPDILCLQETKAHPEQLNRDLLEPIGYHTYWSYAEKKGYSGVATFTKEEPLAVKNGFNDYRFDSEGRTLIVEYPEFILLNIYFPNGKKDEDRLRYKLDFYESFLQYVESLKANGKRIIVCGDFNTAHKEIDLARPKANENVSGFLPVEREWMDKFVNHGYIDSFRIFNHDPAHYTWWDLKSRARERNIGWRIDYFFLSENLLPFIIDAFILPDVMGSDHCPIGLVMKLT